MFSDRTKKRITPLPHDEARALLREYYHVGDKVSIDLLRKGTVTGFGIKHVPRGGINHKMAGVYIDFESLRVIPDLRALPERFECRNMSERTPLDIPNPERWVDREMREKVGNIFIKIGDAPDTPFWKGDRVKIKSVSRLADPEGWIVDEVYHASRDSTTGCRYKLLSTTPELRHEYAGEDLDLFERGNLWKMEHGEPMEFASIDEEAKFYQSLGMSEKVYRNSRVTGEETGWYEYDFADAVSLIRSGHGHEMKVKNSKHVTFVVIKYDRTEFGLRMRAHTLAKFGLSEEVTA
jgi:hypothetical protein